MLVITLTIGATDRDTLYIGNNVQVQVLSMKGHQVRIGITAPPGIVIDRAVVHRARLRDVKAAGQDKVETEEAT